MLERRQAGPCVRVVRVCGPRKKHPDPTHSFRLLRRRHGWPHHCKSKSRDELAAFHVWMAPAWQEIILRAALRSLAVMCPAFGCSPTRLLALMESANRASSFERDQRPTEAAGLSRLRRIDRLCHHASLLSRKLQYAARQPKPPRPWAGNLPAGASPPRRCGQSYSLTPITQGSALVALERSRLALAPLIISRRKY